MPRFLGRNQSNFARYQALPRFAALSDQLPAPPASVDFTAGGAGYAGTLGNTTAGDCTIAGVGHLIQGWTAMTGRPVVFTDAQALAEYSRVEGYDPATGQPDDGMDETVVLEGWTGAGLYGTKLTAYSTVDPTNLTHIQQTIWVFGGIYLGLMLPRSAEQQTDAGQPWTRPWFSPILGGHCVVSQKYDQTYLYVDTWGQLQPVAWDFVQAYFDAAYAPFSRLWLDAQGKSPGGLDAAALMGDLPAVAA